LIQNIAKLYNIINTVDPTITLMYSVRMSTEKYIEEYSVEKPATISDSPSAKSKGTLLHSAKYAIKPITNHTTFTNIKHILPQNTPSLQKQPCK
jgi:hypothetical protein